MKIIVYTITDCQFSKQEKEYLASHTLVYEEKNLETNKESLTEMLTVSNNFAGTPVTKIEKDDGQIVVLKGFTKEEFDKELGFATETPTAPPPVTMENKPVEPAINNPLNSVLDTLQQKSESTVATTPPPVVPTPQPVTPEPTVPPTTTIPPSPPLTTEASAKVAPTIPDFKTS